MILKSTNLIFMTILFVLWSCTEEEGERPERSETPVVDKIEQTPVMTQAEKKKFQRDSELNKYYDETSKPDELCGQQGLKFLIAVYFGPQCKGCHYEGSVIHPNAFADGRNLDLAWADSKKFTKASYIREIKDNERCNDGAPLGVQQCILLNEKDQIYDDIIEWLPRRDEDCPAEES
ncbi:MAG: hypothetical protein CMP10_20615 [Zetaproteobacteria bacterium]|nr:hypothetical protein [Pseudobdellovibrionaceae bacterium]